MANITKIANMGRTVMKFSVDDERILGIRTIKDRNELMLKK